MKSLGVGVLYRDHLNAEVRRGDLKIVSISDLKRIDIESFILYKIDQPLSPNAQEFLGLLRKAQQQSQFDCQCDSTSLPFLLNPTIVCVSGSDQVRRTAVVVPIDETL